MNSRIRWKLTGNSLLLRSVRFGCAPHGLLSNWAGYGRYAAILRSPFWIPLYPAGQMAGDAGGLEPEPRGI